MRRVPNPASVLAVVVSLVLLLGCTKRTPNFIAPGHAGAPGVASVLLLPMNFGSSLPPELEEPAERAAVEVVAFLRARERSVEEITFGVAQNHWTSAVRELKGSNPSASAEDRVAAFLGRLRSKGDFDAVVLPSLVRGQVRVERMFGQWDGVSRRLPTRNEPRLKPGQRGGVVADGFRGDFTVASLQVVVWNRDGSRVFEGRGGLDFLEIVDLTNVVQTRRWSAQLQDDPLSDRKILRNGVRLAFDPYLQP